jgi:hypothetical protein
VRFELSEQTRQAIDDYLKAASKRPGEFLFTGRRGAWPLGECPSRRDPQNGREGRLAPHEASRMGD